MAWGSVGTLGSTQEKVDDTTMTLVTLAAAEAGNVVVVVVATNNDAIGDGDTGEVAAISDESGNTWSKAVEFTNGQGAADAGAVVSIWYSKITTTIPLNGLITVTFTVSSAAKAMTVWEFTIGAGNVVSVEGSATLATDGADPGAITLGSLASQEYLWIHGLAGEGPNADAYTWDADYQQIDGNGTTGGSAASNMHVRGGYRIFTGTTDTVDVTSTTADRDYAQALAALKEGAAPATQGTGWWGSGGAW